MKKIIHTFFLLFTFALAHAQSVEDRAKAYYQEAVKAFDNKDYKQTLEYCKQVTDVLNSTNARIEFLKVKSYYELEQYGSAKASLSSFSSLPANAKLKAEALEYVVKIEEKENELKEKKLAEQRKAEELRLAREKKLADEKREREEAERRSYQSAMTGNVDAIRAFLGEYPNHAERSAAINLLAEKEEQAYQLATERKEVGVYENYLKLFGDGKHRNAVVAELAEAKELAAYQQAARGNSVAAAETYLNAYPSGKNKSKVSVLYADALSREGQAALEAKNYAAAEVLFAKYEKNFPSGEAIKQVSASHKLTQKKIKRLETIANRKDKTYFGLNYTSNKSAGVEVGKLKASHGLSMYWGLNYGFSLPGFSSLIELESLEDYAGDDELKKSFASSSLGFTMMISYPLWVYAGAGVKYQTYEDGIDSYKLAGEKPWQVYPEFGLKARLGKIVILKAGVQLIKDKPAFQVGIGF